VAGRDGVRIFVRWRCHRARAFRCESTIVDRQSRSGHWPPMIQKRSLIGFLALGRRPRRSRRRETGPGR
jgi:hypothetical protein